MKISTVTGTYYKRFGDATALAMLASAGFDGVDYSMFDLPADHRLFSCSDEELLTYYRELLKTARQLHLTVEQFHSPMAPCRTPEEVETYFDLSRRAILAASALDCPYVVVHVIAPNCLAPEDFVRAKEQNMAFFSRLIPFLREYKVQLGIENLVGHTEEGFCPTATSTPEAMVDYIDSLNAMAGQELFVACLDTGHATLLPGLAPEQFVPVLGKRLRLLHVQDTDGKRDLHTFPYSVPWPTYGVIDWDAFCAALKEAGYTGSFSMEADRPMWFQPDNLLHVSSTFMCQIARDMVRRIEG